MTKVIGRILVFDNEVPFYAMAQHSGFKYFQVDDGVMICPDSSESNFYIRFISNSRYD